MIAPFAVDEQTEDQQSLAERVAFSLREMFLNGDLIPGQRLIETEIADQLEVSRGPVRDALKMLQDEGIVRIEPRKGTFVTKLCYEDLSDLYLLRGVIEGLGARLLAERGSPEQIQQLETCLNELMASKNDLKRFGQLDLQFHEMLCSLPGHRWLYRQWMSMKTYIWLFIQASQALDWPGSQEMVDSHAEIFQAIRYGLPILAEQAVKRHSIMSGEEIRLLWERNPGGMNIPPFFQHHMQNDTTEDCS